MIFVFGSNLAGRHGRGAAKDAMTHFGAVYGVGIGRTGHAYAIPTKDANLRPLQLAEIRSHVKAFIEYAKQHPELDFYVTRVGCGLAGYSNEDIAPMFQGVPSNCLMPVKWASLLTGADEHE